MGQTGHGPSLSAAAAAPSEIQSAMADVLGQIEVAWDRLSDLHIALGSVMTPACPKEDSPLKAINSGPSTQMGQALEDHANRLRQMNISLADILNRVQL